MNTQRGSSCGQTAASGIQCVAAQSAILRIRDTRVSRLQQKLHFVRTKRRTALSF
jgi:hypothetical protein